MISQCRTCPAAPENENKWSQSFDIRPHRWCRQMVQSYWPCGANVPSWEGTLGRQCALIGGHIGATWQIQLNSCFLWPTWIHNPNGKLIASTVLHSSRRSVIWANWRHLVNTIEPVLPSANQSPQPKRLIDQFSHFCTAHGRKSGLHFTMGTPFPKIAPSHGGRRPHVTHDSLGPSKPTTQTASRLV